MEKISTGTSVFDKLLKGGYEKDSITTIYGSFGTGKTCLALHGAINQALQNKKVIYIDTEGGFSIERLKQLSNNKKVLQNILFLRPTNFNQQSQAIAKIKNFDLKKVGIIIVDTITMLYRLERSLTNDQEAKKYNRELGLQLENLMEISRLKAIPILIITQVYEHLESGTKLVGGDILSYASKCLIALKNIGGGIRKAILIKNRSLPSAETEFKITSKGIVPAHKFLSLF